MDEQNQNVDNMEQDTIKEEYHPEGPTVRLSYVIRFRDLFGFTMRYALTGINGAAFWLVFALLIWRIISGFANDASDTRTLLIIALVLLIVMMPGNILLRTMAQCKLAKTQNLVSNYEVSNTGIYITQETESELVPWNCIRKVRENRKYIYAYVHKNSAFIFPKELLGDDTDTLKQLINDNTLHE